MGYYSFGTPYKYEINDDGSKKLVPLYKEDLGAQLFNEIETLVNNKKSKKEDYFNFDKKKLIKIQRVFLKYKNSNVDTKMLYAFLETYNFYNRIKNESNDVYVILN